MKFSSSRILVPAFTICLTSLLSVADAKIVITNESKSTNVWALPDGPNLLTSSTVVSSVPQTREGSSGDWATLFDGDIGSEDAGPETSVTPSNSSEVIFALDLSSKPEGYDITSFDSYCAWANSGRDNQDYTLLYSSVSDPNMFIPIAAVNNHTGSDRSTHTRITNDNGYLAKGVHSIKVIFAHNQENGYTGFREFVLQDNPVTVCVMTEANDENNFFLPGGVNLLAGITPPEIPAVHEDSSSSWSTVTDGSLGDYKEATSSVTPSNGQTVTFPLDLSEKPSGHTIYSFDSFCAWGSNGRDDQNYEFSYSTVAEPEVFIPLATVAAHTEYNGPNSRHATHARITANGGPLATEVHSVRLTFDNQENGFTGFREFFLSDQPINETLYEASESNDWPLPAGVNLLANAIQIDPDFPAGADHGNNDITSQTWGVLTDGTLGSAANQQHAVAPLNRTSVIYELDTTVNTLGYNLTSFDAYAAWNNTGRDNQDFTILYSTVSDPDIFHPIETIANHTSYPFNSTHTRVQSPTGYLAKNVGAVKFYFDNQENGYVGYREFIVQGQAVPLFDTLTWSGLDGSGGAADWVDAVDNNWKDESGGAPFNALAPLSFDSSGINTEIFLPASLTVASATFASDDTVDYSFDGSELTLTNGIDVIGSGSAVFNNSLTTSNINLSGTGSLTLSGDNWALDGSVVVDNGDLYITNDSALGEASLVQTGGSVHLSSQTPSVTSISGTGGSLVLGNSEGSGGETLLFLGSENSSSYAGDIIDATATAYGSLFKVGTGTLTLSGANTYTGTTTVEDGELVLASRTALYNGDTSSWTAENLEIFTNLTLRVGGVGEFTSSDVAALDTNSFLPGAVLSLDTTSGDAEVGDIITGDISLAKTGINSLTLSGTNTFTEGIALHRGALFAANLSGVSIPSNLTVGNATFNTFAIMAHDDQFGPGAIIHFDTGNSVAEGKFNMRGTTQTVAGLNSPEGNRVAIIQNDEVNSPGYTSEPEPATLIIDTPEYEYYQFYGIIRNQVGDPLSLVKRGLGMQELSSNSVQGYGYSGLTSVEEGTLRLNLSTGHTGFASDIDISEAATLDLHAVGSNYEFGRVITGDGKVLVTGSNAVILRNAANAWTGGLTVDGGFLALHVANGGALGEGDGPGQTCVAGVMDPSNVIELINGGVLSLDGAAALGNSPMLPEFAPSIIVNEGSTLFGGTNTVAFVPNVTLDGGNIQVHDGANTGGFGTNLALVGTVIVGGDSDQPAEIYTTGSGDNANLSLGSLGLPGTTFHVEDVTSSPDADLIISSVIRDVREVSSPLVKTGPGTMVLEGVNTYTGPTTILDGELVVSGGQAIADTNVLIIDGGKLNLESNESVYTLFIDGLQQEAGTYGSTDSTATHKDDMHFSGNAVLTVLSSTSPADPYSDWADMIPNPAERDKNADPDGDGFTNIEEFLFGTSPIEPNGSLTEMEIAEEGLVLRWNQRIDTGSYRLLESETLEENSWFVSTAPISDNPVQNLQDYVRKQAVIPVDSARKFIRVEASE